MATTLEDLLTQAIGLAPEDRARLSDLLLASLPDGMDADTDAAWNDEVQRRIDAVQAGTARLIPAADVHAEARQIYKG